MLGLASSLAWNPHPQPLPTGEGNYMSFKPAAGHTIHYFSVLVRKTCLLDASKLYTAPFASFTPRAPAAGVMFHNRASLPHCRQASLPPYPGVLTLSGLPK